MRSKKQEPVHWPVSALASGALLACAFPPIRLPWLAAVGLVPLLGLLFRDESPAAAPGFLAGLAFFLMCGHPLTSASVWGGWAEADADRVIDLLSREGWVLHGLWLFFALWCALWWAAWAVVARAGWRRGAGSGLATCAAGWIVLAEWGRAATTFGCTWAFLGNALATNLFFRQAASLGGVWLLSLALILVNLGVAALLYCRGAKRRVGVAAVGAAAFIWVTGLASMPAEDESRPTVPVAVLHYEKPGPYSMADYLPLRLERGYASMLHVAIEGRARLVVLPESSVFGLVMLDGAPADDLPVEHQVSVQAWDEAVHGLLAGTPTMLVVGMETAVSGRHHNSLVAWTGDGRLGVYHKRRLVPFAEYQPAAWRRLGLRGRSQYQAGDGSQLLRAGDLVLGGLLCQEVVYPALSRASVRDGATLLVSGAQDGVFIDPVVAEIESGLARLRAVETGRYLVRAVKEGISAVIDPAGRELVRSGPGTGEVLRAEVRPLRRLTPYVRFGDWVVWMSLAWLVAQAGGIRRRRRS